MCINMDKFQKQFLREKAKFTSKHSICSNSIKACFAKIIDFRVVSQDGEEGDEWNQRDSYIIGFNYISKVVFP